MKRHICTLVGVMMAICLSAPSHAQQPQQQLTTGTHFLVGFLHPDRAPGEPLADSSYRIIVTAEKGARVAVGSRVFAVEPNVPFEVKLPVTTVVDVTSDRPITVVSRQVMLGNGEQSWHLPVTAWGTIYRPFAWWTDRHGLDSASLMYSSAQRLIIAAHNGTKVTVQTIRGVIDTTLDAGQWWLVKEGIDTASYRNTTSDPTGLLITATKPVGVISGHAKAAVLAYPDGLPMTGPYARSANRCRGNLQDAMLPATMGGTEFVTVPMIYTPTRERGLDLRDQGIGDDRGDVVRFVALEDSTAVMRITSTGTADTVAILSRGSSWMGPRVEQSTLWQTSRPTLCAQYGKSYGHITSQTVRPEDDPSTDAGMPLLMTVPGTDRWSNHATLQTFSETFNALSLTVRTADLPVIRINGIAASAWGKHSAITGSPFTTMRLVLPHGAYTITADSGRTFCCWTYGSLDGFQLGRIYGSIAGMDLRNICADSVSLLVNISTDSASAIALVSSSGTPCSEIAMLYLDDPINIDWERRDSVLVMRHRDKRASASGNVVAVSTSGRRITQHVSFTATSVVDLDDKDKPRVHHDRTTNTIVVSHLGYSSDDRVSVFSLDGRCLYESSVSGDPVLIPAHLFRAGLHIVHVNKYVLSFLIM
ncbi:MAG: hypothetical protein FGM32_07685 [Candidatus Kapabacteria bacterium]|nr:hypothetical protein [Candidatus Kapabacteria bacterium]